MSLSVGKRRGLTTCSTINGVFAILAMDQRGSLRKALKPNKPEAVHYDDLVGFKKEVISTLAPEATAVLLDPEYGAAQNIASDRIPGSTGLIIALEETGYSGETFARKSEILSGWSVEKAQRLGASGVKLLIYYHPRSTNADSQRELIRDVASSCQKHDLAFFLEPLAYNVDPNQPKLSPIERKDVIVEMAQELSALGPDILKLEFPVDVKAEPDESVWLDACHEITQASQVPWVLLSAGVDFDLYLRQVVTACRSGACGIMAGRAVWKEAISLEGSQREEFLRGIAVPRFKRLRSVCEGLAKTWKSYYQQSVIQENWYQA